MTTNQKTQQKPETAPQQANPLQSLKELKNSLMGAGAAGVGSLAELKRIMKTAGKKLGINIPHADFDSLTREQKRAVRLAMLDRLPQKEETPSSPDLVNRAKGGLVKKKKPKKAGRLAKRGYGAARK